MKFFMNKSIWAKIIIVLVIIILFEFIISKPSLGKDDGFGGKLLSPIVSLVVALADAGVEVMQTSIMETEETLIHVDLEDSGWKIFKWIIKIAVFAAAVIAIIVSAGTLTLVVGAAIALCFAGEMAGLYNSVMDTAIDGIKNSIVGYGKDQLPDNLYLPVYSISPEEIFQGHVLLFNVDFFGKPKEILPKKEDGEIKYYYYIDDDGNEVTTSPQDTAQHLRAVISKWYVALRNIGLVAMLIILLYVGIRMLLSTVSSDKAKYKQMLYDWFVGLVILFTAHYFMVFSVRIVDAITKMVSSSVSEDMYTVAMQDKDEKIAKVLKDGGMEDFIGEDGSVAWPTNLMGSIRLRAQLANWGSEFIGYAICFVVLVIFTGFFIITYMKRVVYMAFLTLIAPLVAVTYPIDKLNDGSAQGFNRWFKEYVFNLLIQPLHLLLYYILVTSAFELVSDNIIYALVAIGFMLPAEKMMRSLFGFEKSNTAPSMATGAALGMGLAQLMKPKPSKLSAGKGKGGSSGEQGNSDNGRIHMSSSDVDADQVLADTLRFINIGHNIIKSITTSNVCCRFKLSKIVE